MSHSPEGCVSFGDMARQRLGEQCQYVSRFVDGFAGRPALGEGLRFVGDPRDYHSLVIHQDDVEEFIHRYEGHRRR